MALSLALGFIAACAPPRDQTRVNNLAPIDEPVAVSLWSDPTAGDGPRHIFLGTDPSITALSVCVGTADHCANDASFTQAKPLGTRDGRAFFQSAQTITPSIDSTAHIATLGNGDANARFVVKFVSTTASIPTNAPENVRVMRQGCVVTGDAQKEVLKNMRAGISEGDLKTVIDTTFRTGGASGNAFDHIVGSGPNSVDLHYSGSRRVLAAGDLVVVDIGAQFGGYSTDITRTYPVSGQFTERQRAVYQLVLDALRLAEREAKNGVSLNGLHRKVVAFFQASALRARDRSGQERTMDTFFTHSLGHFIDRVVHASGNTSAAIPVNATFTIEPGIYIPAEGFGIRLENTYVMTPEGAVNLNPSVPYAL